MNYWQSKDGNDKRLLFMMNGSLTAVSADNGEKIASFGENGGVVDLRNGLAGDWHQGAACCRPTIPAASSRTPSSCRCRRAISPMPRHPADIHAYDIVTGALKWVFHIGAAEGRVRL